ncbi:MAG: molybdopterin molybdotransferase MoeA [Acidobacteria bacterium]|nr:molybdopterin molybdotransferase MoeA [Acidobacteriota bacterium]
MIEISEALRIIERETPKLGVEKIRLADSVGRVLAEEIEADTDLPPFDRSQMDGYAVVAADTKHAPVALKVVGESAAGRGWHHTMKRGEAVRIMTGARVPVGADAVQRVELTSGWEGQSVTIHESVEKGTSIVRQGAEVKKGTKIFADGIRVTENMISAIASFGYSRLKVGKMPAISILATGSEIVPIGRKPARDQIRNSNSVMLEVLCQGLGCPTETLPTPKDDIDDLKSKIQNLKSKILIVTGGVSAGKYDLTKAALQELGAQIFFEKVRLKPGKPAVFARFGKTLVFGLPGNPVSAAVTFQLFVRKAIMLMQGASETDLKRGTAVLASTAKAPRDRDAYIPSALSTDKHGRLLAMPLKSQGSSDFVGFSRADSLITLKRGTKREKGEVADILFL